VHLQISVGTPRTSYKFIFTIILKVRVTIYKCSDNYINGLNSLIYEMRLPYVALYLILTTDDDFKFLNWVKYKLCALDTW
jgi:hypothetical protein